MSAPEAPGRDAQPDAMPRVSIIVPTYRDWPRAQLCLDALARQSYPAERTEIFIVNNDPDDPPPEDLRVPDNCTVLTEAAKGSYAARNRGLEASEGGIVTFTDADCIPDPGWCAALVGCLSAPSAPPRVGGRIRLMQPADRNSIAAVYTIAEMGFAMPQDEYVGRGWAATANMATRVEVFDAVGLFDARHFSGGDQEWGRRADAAGFPITFCEEAVVDHPAREPHEIITKHRRVQGARLRRKRAEKGAAFAVGYFLYHAVRRILIPPTGPIPILMRLHHVPRRARVATYFFIYYTRLVIVADSARILLLGRQPERR